MDIQLELEVDIQRNPTVQDNHLMEDIRNLVEQGSQVVEEILLMAQNSLDQAVLNILAVAMERLAGKDIQDLLGLLHIVDIQDTSHVHVLQKPKTTNTM